jgi:hypothetical protein
MARRKLSDDTEALSARIAVLEAICAEAYQAVGAAGAPARVLDQLWAAAQGAPIPHETILPILAEDFDEVASREARLREARAVLGVSAAAELGRVGGSRTSRAKRQASRANGAKGGRPRTQTATAR